MAIFRLTPVGIPALNKQYAVSREGDVFKNIDHGLHVPVPLRDDGRGYMCFDACNRTYKVHNVVWKTFRGEVPKGFHIDHIDHNKLNNSINNLRLRDARENSSDCKKTSRKGCRVLSVDQRKMVATLCAEYKTKAIADLCDIGQSTVRRIRKTLKPQGQRNDDE